LGPGMMLWQNAAAELLFVFVLRGSATLQTGERSEPLGEGDCCVVPAGTSHGPADRSPQWELLEISAPAAGANTAGEHRAGGSLSYSGMGELLFPAFDPVLLDLPGPFDIRWYGLMYVVAFVLGQQVIMRLCRAGFLGMPEQRVGDLVFWMVLGVL